MSATLPAAEPGLRYVLRRIAVYLGAQERVLATLVSHGARADGWLTVEALQALSGSQIAAGRVGSLRLRGERELELEIDGRPTAIRVRSLPDPDVGRLAELAPELAEVARAGGTLLAVTYPQRADDAAWREATAELERGSGARLAEQVQVQLAGPDRVTVSLWVPAGPDAEASLP